MLPFTLTKGAIVHVNILFAILWCLYNAGIRLR